MENLKALYLEYCKTYNAEPQEIVTSEFKRLTLTNDELSKTLNFSSHHLTDKTCMILSKLLAHDQKFNCLMLNDCSLSNEGLKDFCHAMITNTSIITLELKVKKIIFINELNINFDLK
jgi:Ran GTPase-activating protein (RanGAP) involved in mRNA processing and transport